MAAKSIINISKAKGCGRFFGLICGFLMLAASAMLGEVTPDQQSAAFSAAAAIAKESYHWVGMTADATPVPIEATTARTLLPVSGNLTTLTWTGAETPIYKAIEFSDHITYNCTLVGTFTKPNYGFWDTGLGTDKRLSYMDVDVVHYIQPWVTSGTSLQSYLVQNYYSGMTEAPASADVAMRITQSLGLYPVAADVMAQKGLAFFWVPMENIARPAYSSVIGTQLPTLETWGGDTTTGNGTYKATNEGTPAGFNYVDFKDDKILYSGSNATTDFIEYNQAETTYPWSAMGYTYNWNALQDGTVPAYGDDPFHVASAIGLSEFVVSGNSTVMLADWIPYANLGSWASPDPGSVFLLVFAGGCIFFFRRWAVVVLSARARRETVLDITR